MNDVTTEPAWNCQVLDCTLFSYQLEWWKETSKISRPTTY